MIEFSIDRTGFLLIALLFFNALWNTSVGPTGGVTFAALAALLGPTVAIPLQAVVEGISGVFRSWTLRTYVDRQFLGTFIVGGSAGFGVGLAVFKLVEIPDWLLEAGVGGFILLAAWVPISKAAAIRRGTAPAVGAVTSFLSLFVGGMGAPISTGIHASGAEHKTVIATSTSAVMFQYAVKLVIFGLAGFSFARFADLMIALTIASLTGTWLGGKVIIRIPSHVAQQAFKIVVTVIGASLLVRSLRGRIGVIPVESRSGLLMAAGALLGIACVVALVTHQRQWTMVFRSAAALSIVVSIFGLGFAAALRLNQNRSTAASAESAESGIVAASAPLAVVPEPGELQLATKPGEPVATRIETAGVVSLVSLPSHGIVQVESSGQLIYLPDTEFEGVDRFVIRSCRNGQCLTSAIAVGVDP